MNKEELDQRFIEYSQEQVNISAQIQKMTAQVQQLEGKKLLCQEMYQKLEKSEGKIVALPDPPKDEQATNQTPAS